MIDYKYRNGTKARLTVDEKRDETLDETFRYSPRSIKEEWRVGDYFYSNVQDVNAAEL